MKNALDEIHGDSSLVGRRIQVETEVNTGARNLMEELANLPYFADWLSSKLS